MEKRLIEGPFRNGTKYFHFCEYDDWEIFLEIVKVVKEKICPEEIKYSGLDDISGYFIKEGIRVDFEYDSITRIAMIYRDTGHSQDLEKVRSWVQIIWDELQKQHGN